MKITVVTEQHANPKVIWPKLIDIALYHHDRHCLGAMAGSNVVVYFEACGNFEPRVQFTAPLTVLFILNWFDTLPNTHNDSVKSDNVRLFMSRKKATCLESEMR